MEAGTLVRELGARIGVELEFDADGICAFKADDMAVTMHDLEGEEIAVVGDIGAPPPEGLETLYRTMLEANHLFGGTGGATISFDSEHGRFSLVKVFECRSLDPDAFFEAVSKFVSVLELWTKLNAEWRLLPHSEPSADGSLPPENAVMV